MNRWFPGFRWADLLVLTVMLAILAILAARNPHQVLQEGVIPVALVIGYALWSWRRR
jgi:hypothetical protein